MKMRDATPEERTQIQTYLETLPKGEYSKILDADNVPDKGQDNYAINFEWKGMHVTAWHNPTWGLDESFMLIEEDTPIQDESKVEKKTDAAARDIGVGWFKCPFCGYVPTTSQDKFLTHPRLMDEDDSVLLVDWTCEQCGGESIVEAFSQEIRPLRRTGTTSLHPSALEQWAATLVSQCRICGGKVEFRGITPNTSPGRFGADFQCTTNPNHWIQHYADYEACPKPDKKVAP